MAASLRQCKEHLSRQCREPDSHFLSKKKKKAPGTGPAKGNVCTHNPDENGHPLGFFFFSSSQTDYAHLTRPMAGKLHWLLGLVLLLSASSMLDRSQSCRCLIFSKWGAALVQGSVFGFHLFPIHMHLLGELIQPMALNTSYLLTAPHFLMPAKISLTKFRPKPLPPFKHLSLDV